MGKGKMSSSSLDIYTCTALAGVCTEYVLFGESEGGLNDVQQLDGLLRALQVVFQASLYSVVSTLPPYNLAHLIKEAEGQAQQLHWHFLS